MNTKKKSSTAESLKEEEEELEPLFDYRRVQPFSVIDIEDDPLDYPPVGCKKKPKITDTAAVEKNDKKGDSVIIDSDDKEEDDWLPPSPKVVINDASIFSEDSTRRELRLKRQELASLAQSAEEALRTVEEHAKRDLAAAQSMNEGVNASVQSPRKDAVEKPSKPSKERPKIVISIQDKNGPMQVRVYMDDKFEKLFKMYAEKVKLDLQSLVFVFDGDRISPTATPGGLGMEDNDIIEVHMKTK